MHPLTYLNVKNAQKWAWKPQYQKFKASGTILTMPVIIVDTITSVVKYYNVKQVIFRDYSVATHSKNGQYKVPLGKVASLSLIGNSIRILINSSNFAQSTSDQKHIARLLTEFDKVSKSLDKHNSVTKNKHSDHREDWNCRILSSIRTKMLLAKYSKCHSLRR